MKTFNVSFPEPLADEIDRVAKEQFGTRSDFLRMAAIKYLREEQQWKELMAYGKEIGKQTGDQSEEEVAAFITERRRKNRLWKPEDFKDRT